MLLIKRAIKKLLLLEPFRQWIRFDSKYQPRILMYHRLNQKEDGQGITPQQFEEHLIFLKYYFKILTLEASLLRHKRSGRPSLALTFDDGYSDFYHFAWPLLKKHQVPATLFVTTKFIAGEQWLWPDKLRFILNSAEKNKSLSTATKTQLHWSKIADELLTLTPKQQNFFLDKLAEEHKINVPALPTEEFSPLTWQQLKTMQDEGLDIQCHTHSHPILALLNEDELEEELSTSLKLIKENLGKEAWALAYPNGRLEDVSPIVMTIARSLGLHLGLLARNYDIDDSLSVGRIASTANTTELIWRTLRNQTHPIS